MKKDIIVSNLLVILLEEFQIKLKKLDGFVPRDEIFPNIENKIKVAIGMRRVGKTTFVYQHIQKLLNDGIPLTQILYLNFEDDRLLPMSQKEFAKLLEDFYTLYPENHEKKCYFFFDEIQNVEEWALVIRRFFDSKQVEIFLTGSSAKLLSKEIATSLRGRSIATEIWPFSFKEYLIAKKVEIDTKLYGKVTRDKLQKEFMNYLSEGGFPEVVHYDQSTRQDTLQEYIQVVILRDIIERYNISNYELIKYLVKTLLNLTASNFSINKIYNDLKSQGFAVGKDTLYEYLSYIEDSYIAFAVQLHSESLRKSQVNPRKIYAIDTGLVKAHTFSFMSNLGRMFENIVYLDLRRMGCEVQYYLTQERYEVDFLAVNKQRRACLLQIVWDDNDLETLMREKRALQLAEKELGLPGKIITLESYLREGIF